MKKRLLTRNQTFFVAGKKQKERECENEALRTVEINQQNQLEANNEGSFGSGTDSVIPDEIAPGRFPGFPRNHMERDESLAIGERQNREMDISTSKFVCDGNVAIDEMATSTVNESHIKAHQTDPKVTVIGHVNREPVHDFSPSRLPKPSPLETAKQQVFHCHPDDKTPTRDSEPSDFARPCFLQ